MKVKPKKSSPNLGTRPNLVARFCGLFEILDRTGYVGYALAFPACLHVHNVFHVSLLKKDLFEPNHIICWDLIQVNWKELFRCNHYVSPITKLHC